MVAETLIRDAMKAVVVPINEDTVLRAREAVAENVDKLTAHYRPLIAREYALRSLMPDPHKVSNPAVDQLARLQADFTYADILALVAYPENSLHIKHARADKIRARRRMHLFLDAEPTPEDITSAFTLAQGIIPPAASDHADPEALLDHRSELETTDFIEVLPEQLVLLVDLFTGDDSIDAFQRTYERIHRLHLDRMDSLVEDFTTAIMALPDTTDNERTVRRYVEDDCTATSIPIFWETLQEQLIQLLERTMEQHTDLFLSAPTALHQHVETTLGGGRTGTVLADISHVARLVGSATTTGAPHQNSPLSHDLIVAQLKAQRQQVTPEAISRIREEKNLDISLARDHEHFPELFCQEIGEHILTPEEAVRLYTQAQHRGEADVVEEMAVDIDYLEERNEELWEEYIRQIDSAISDTQGSDFFHSCSYAELEAERAKIMSTVPFEEFIP